MSLQYCHSPQRVLVFEPSANGVQIPKNCDHYATTNLIDKMGSHQSDAVESVSQHNDADSAKFLLHSSFLGLFVRISGMPTTFLLIELEFTASSLIDHFFNWTENCEQVNDDGGSLIYRSFTCMFMFQHAYVTVEKKESGDFVVKYQTFNNPERFGDPRNGGFPRARLEFNYMDPDPEDESKKLVQVLPFCHPMTLKDASDASYNFARLNVHVDPEKNFLFFVFRSLSFRDEDEDEDREFEMKAIEFSFPIRSSGRTISSPIDFGSENGNYIASFTIKIGDEDYSIRFSFGTFEGYSVDHRNGYYTLSAINHWTDSTTIFCQNTDAEELMEQTMTRLGILSIEIPEFVAPETDDESALRPLPEDLQAFLRSITWCNPEARIAQFARAAGSN